MELSNYFIPENQYSNGSNGSKNTMTISTDVAMSYTENNINPSGDNCAKKLIFIISEVFLSITCRLKDVKKAFHCKNMLKTNRKTLF